MKSRCHSAQHCADIPRVAACHLLVGMSASSTAKSVMSPAISPCNKGPTGTPSWQHEDTDFHTQAQHLTTKKL